MNRDARAAEEKWRGSLSAAIVLAFMICTMHYALTVTAAATPDASVAIPPYLIPADMLGIAVVGAVPIEVADRMRRLLGPGEFLASWLYHGPRLALEPVIVWWALYCADVVDWPWRRNQHA